MPITQQASRQLLRQSDGGGSGGGSGLVDPTDGRILASNGDSSCEFGLASQPEQLYGPPSLLRRSLQHSMHCGAGMGNACRLSSSSRSRAMLEAPQDATWHLQLHAGSCGVS